jgi:hypothetical protein
MNSFLFEYFWLWLFAGLAASGGCIFLSAQRRTTFWLVAAKIVPVIFTFLLIVNICVVTDQEAIQAQLDQILSACTAGDVARLGKLLDEDFSASGMTKQEFLEQAKGAFTRLTLGQISLSDVVMNPPRHSVRLASYTHLRSRGGNDFGWIRSDWELTFLKRNKIWLLHDVQPLSLYLQPVKDMREIFNRSHQAQ